MQWDRWYWVGKVGRMKMGETGWVDLGEEGMCGIGLSGVDFLPNNFQKTQNRLPTFPIQTPCIKT